MKNIFFKALKIDGLGIKKEKKVKKTLKKPTKDSEGQ